MDPKNVGVIGAGVIGRGVAQALAHAGHLVILVDVAAEALEAARSEIAQGLRLHRMLGGGDGEPAAGLDRIRFSLDGETLKEADFVVENVTESWPVKTDVYRRLDRTCRPDVIFAANTSAIPITRLASLTARPERMVGMHFMNPVPLKPTVEVIRGHHTSDATIEQALGLLADMKKEGIVVHDGPGFVANRVLMLAINEAAFVVQEGVASAEDTDRIFTKCLGHRMGMLETADLIGLDTVLRSIEVLCESFNDSKYRPCPLLKRMVAAGLLGRKSGEGFYRYHR